MYTRGWFHIFGVCPAAVDGLPGQRAWIVWELVDGRSVFSHGPVHLGSGHFEADHLTMPDDSAQASGLVQRMHAGCTAVHETNQACTCCGQSIYPRA